MQKQEVSSNRVFIVLAKTDIGEITRQTEDQSKIEGIIEMLKSEFTVSEFIVKTAYF